MIVINQKLTIPASEIELRTSSSSGPGGQNVNRVRTKVTLLFDVYASSSLNDGDRKLVVEGLKSRINKAGVLQVSSQKHRSQEQNRCAAAARLVELLRGALKEENVRRPTQVSRHSKLNRLEEKKHRSRVKHLRQNPAEKN